MKRRYLAVPAAMLVAAVYSQLPFTARDATSVPTTSAVASLEQTGHPPVRPAREPGFVAVPDRPTPAIELTRQIEGALGRNQTVAGALTESGLSALQIAEAVAALGEVFDFRKTRAGAQFTVELTADDSRLDYLALENGLLDCVEASRDGDQSLVGRRVELPVETRVEAIGVEIQGSLYQSLQNVGETPELAAALADVFAWDIDFYRDQHPGDRLRLLVEKRWHEDQLVGYGRVLAAEYDGRIGTVRTFWFAPGGDQKKGDYYLEDGRSARKMFLATPLKYTRVSSRFSYKRRHPILGYNRAHLGVDYAAPRGTPVRAMAGGTVILAGRFGASGNLVKIRHRSGLVSAYAHLHRISRGIRRGVRVKQKQTIGTVGSTGRATGPHLHFGVIKNGRHVNPQKLKMSRLESVAKVHRKEFERMLAERVSDLGTVVVPAAGVTPIAELASDGGGPGAGGD